MIVLAVFGVCLSLGSAHRLLRIAEKWSQIAPKPQSIPQTANGGRIAVESPNNTFLSAFDVYSISRTMHVSRQYNKSFFALNERFLDELSVSCSIRNCFTLHGSCFVPAQTLVRSSLHHSGNLINCNNHTATQTLKRRSFKEVSCALLAIFSVGLLQMTVVVFTPKSSHNNPNSFRFGVVQQPTTELAQRLSSRCQCQTSANLFKRSTWLLPLIMHCVNEHIHFKSIPCFQVIHFTCRHNAYCIK